MKFGLKEKSAFVLRKTIDCTDIDAYIHIDYEISRLKKKRRLIKIFFSKLITTLILKIPNIKISSYIKVAGNTEKFIKNKKVKRKILLAKLINIYSILWDLNLRKELMYAYKTIKKNNVLSIIRSSKIEELIIKKINYIENIFHKLGVEIIYLSTTNTIESSIIIQAARNRDIKIVQIASSAMQFSLIGYIPNVVDLIYVLSEKCKEKLLLTNQYKKSQIKLYSINSNLLNLKKNKECTLLVFEQIRSALNPNIMKYWELILKESSNYGELIVRLHPKQNLNYIKVKDILRLKRHYKFEVSNSSLKNDFLKVDRVIGTNSTVLIEASLMGLPVAQIKETKLDNYEDIKLLPIKNIKEFISRKDKIYKNYMKEKINKNKSIDLIFENT